VDTSGKLCLKKVYGKIISFLDFSSGKYLRKKL